MNKLLLTLLVCAGSIVDANASRDILLRDTSIQKMDTLTIMLAESNRIYFYENSLEEDASNLKTTTARGIESWITRSLYESTQKAYQLLILLKIQEQSTLNDNSKKAIEYIKQKNYKQVDLKEVEKELIRLTEAVQKD
jgi:hypothetical protein